MTGVVVRAAQVGVLLTNPAGPEARRAALVQATQRGYSPKEVEEMTKKLHADGLLNVSRGRTSKVKVA
jgi:hypothetical protein